MAKANFKFHYEIDLKNAVMPINIYNVQSWENLKFYKYSIF